MREKSRKQWQLTNGTHNSVDGDCVLYNSEQSHYITAVRRIMKSVAGTDNRFSRLMYRPRRLLDGRRVRYVYSLHDEYIHYFLPHIVLTHHCWLFAT